EKGGDDAALKERLLWASRILADLDGLDGFEELEEAEEPFASAFLRALEPIRAEKEAFYDLVEKARQGDEEAKAQLRDSGKYREMASFLRGQLRPGNGELAGRIAEALAEKNEGGEHSLDLVSADGKPARLFLGSDPAR